MANIEDQIEKQIAEINNSHALGLTREDVQLVGGEIYINSRKAAEFLKTSFHAFSTTYVACITGIKGECHSWVRRIKGGKTKWYHLGDLQQLLQASITHNKSVLEVCKLKPPIK
jgi:hypothetical protein